MHAHRKDTELVYRWMAGDRYFEVVRVLDGERVNAHHIALAELGASGVVRAIVTTNFDTLIERAFRLRGVPRSVFSSEADYDALASAAPEGVLLLKVHGSARFPASIVDTVSQKLRGIPLLVRNVISDVIQDRRRIVLGMSGYDFVFSESYLPLFEQLRLLPAVTAGTRSSGFSGDQGTTWRWANGPVPMVRRCSST